MRVGSWLVVGLLVACEAADAGDPVGVPRIDQPEALPEVATTWNPPALLVERGTCWAKLSEGLPIAVREATREEVRTLGGSTSRDSTRSNPSSSPTRSMRVEETGHCDVENCGTSYPASGVTGRVPSGLGVGAVGRKEVKNDATEELVQRALGQLGREWCGAASTDIQVASEAEFLVLAGRDHAALFALGASSRVRSSSGDTTAHAFTSGGFIRK